MNIEKKTIDAVNAVLTIKIEKADYQEKVEKSLRDYRKKANVPGFRAGMVPVGLLKKMYGKAIMAEEVNKLVSEGLHTYIKENELSVLGEPLPSENQEVFDFEAENDFTFSFDLGLAPEFKVNLTKKDKVKYYTIKPDDNMIDNQIKAHTGRFGSYLQEEIVEEKDMVKGLMLELDAEGKAKENGLQVEAAVLTPSYMKDKKTKTKFVGAKKGDTIVFNPQKSFDKNEAELSSLLKIEKEEVANMTADFSFAIDGITRYKEAEMNQELFDKVFGEGIVKTEEEFRAKIVAGLEETLSSDSQYKFGVDVKEAVVKKTNKLVFPEAFLKRWVLETNKEMTKEAIDADFDKMLIDLKWHIAKDKIAKDNELKIEAADLDAYARKVAKTQFAQYGMLSVPDDILENYSKDMMKNQDSVRGMYEKVIEEKVFDSVKELVTLDNVEVSIEEFNKMFEEK